MSRLQFLPLLFALACSDSEEPTAAEVPALQGSESSWTLQPESTTGWTGTKPGGSHTGGFSSLSGYAEVGEGNSLEALVIQIEMSSITSDNPKLTKHLKTADFFDIETHSTSSFTMTSVKGDVLQGNLELMGQTETISAPLTLTWGEGSLQLAGDFSIDRNRWGVTYHSKALGTVADKIIDDQVALSLDLSFKAP